MTREAQQVGSELAQFGKPRVRDLSLCRRLSPLAFAKQISRRVLYAPLGQDRLCGTVSATAPRLPRAGRDA